MNDQKLLAHSVNVTLSENISVMVDDAYQLVGKSYPDIRAYEHHPHLTILTKFMDEGRTDDFIEHVTGVLANLNPFEISFSGITKSDKSSYLFLNLDGESAKKLSQLNSLLLDKLSDIGSEGQDGSDKPKYPFAPHISIIKTAPEQLDSALALLDQTELRQTMTVGAFEITREEINPSGASKFPVVCTIQCRE